MGDQAALQEAIQRARQLAAKISQNAPVKRPASEMEDHSIGTVKVTLAYEKPAGAATGNNNDRSSPRRSSSIHRESSHMRASSRDNNDDRGRRGTGDRSGDRRGDRDSIYSGNGDSNNNAYSRSGRESSNPPPSLGHSGGGGGQYSMLSGQFGGGGGGPSDDRIEIIIPHAVIGLVIGKGGENIKRIQNETGATVRVDPNTVDEKGNKVCTITGTKQAVEEAHNQVASVIENAATNKRPRMQVEGSEQYRMKIPASRTGAIIGKGGETIKSIKAQSGCDIELDKNAKECGPEESVFIIRGTQDKILKARALIEARLASRGRDGGDRDSHQHSRSSSGPKGVATGANAAPVAAYTDLPSAATSGPQSSAEVTAAWAAYMAQYSNHMFNQPTGAAASPGGLPGYPSGQAATGLGSMGVQAAPAQAPMMTQQPSQIPQTPQAPTATTAVSGQSAPDYSNQWIEFYIAMGRPDYAQQVVELKKKQQQELLEQQQNNDNINNQNEH